jgi:hypothetical protein
MAGREKRGIKPIKPIRPEEGWANLLLAGLKIPPNVQASLVALSFRLGG